MMRLKRPIAAVVLGLGLGLAALPASAEEFQTVVDPVEVFKEGYIQVVGFSEEGQRQFNAIRAATVVAQRDLLEQFKGLAINGETTILDGMLASDTVRTKVSGFLRGARKCGQRFDRDKGFAEVCLRLKLRGKGGAYEVVYPMLEKANLLPPAEEPVKLTPEQETTEKPMTEEAAPQAPETAAPVEEPAPAPKVEANFDGLIIELSGLGFKPAIVNRVLSDNGEVIFDPSKVVNAILVERGCGGFTNQVGKAKGLLASWGAKKPLMLKAKEAHRGTDAVIAGTDAKSVNASDANTAFLSQAKVVFVIN